MITVRYGHWFLMWLLASTCSVVFAESTPSEPHNLAATASVSASNEFSSDYLAAFAIDGDVPRKLGRDDSGRSWAVQQNASDGKGWFSLRWDQPVLVAEIVYFARTSFLMHECWKDFQLYIDDESTPVAAGQFEMKHGPQRIALEHPRTLSSLKLVFGSACQPGNTGAAEIAVFDTSTTDEQIANLFGDQSVDLPGALPDYLQGLGIDQPKTAELRKLIVQLKQLHGDRYRQADEHLERLRQIEMRGTKKGLADLQQQVLLFDVERLLVIKRHEISASHVYTYHYESQSNGGGLYIVDPSKIASHNDPLEPNDGIVELFGTPDGQILDCDLSFDGTRVLFSMRRGERAGYHLFVINVDGSDLQQLTNGPWHDYNACWLSDGGIAFLSSREPQFAYCWHAPVGTLHRMEANGSNVVKLSANYLNDFTPYVLNDGRIIYSRWEYVDRPAIPIQSLWTVSPDGTSLAGYFGNRVLSPGTFMDARSIPDSHRVICTMTGHNGPTRGAIGVIDNQFGANAQQAIVNLTPDTPLAHVDQGNGNTEGTKPYSCPLPLDSQRFLVSARGPLLVRTMDGRCQSTAIPMPEDGQQYFSATPLAARQRPPIIPTQMRDPTLGDDAVIYMQDVYNGLEPEVKRGEIKQIRVVREMSKPLRIDPDRRAFGFQFPVISCGATYAGKDVLGDIPIGEDGSAYFKVPSGVPLYFIALDREGRAVQRMRSFTHLMPGERQGCVGCHADRLNAAAPTLGRLDFSQPPLELERPQWMQGQTDSDTDSSPGFDYARMIQPIWNEHCVECHHPKEASGGVDLTGDQTDFFNVSYEMLARDKQGREGSRFVNWIPTYNGQEWNVGEVSPRRWGSYRSRLAEIVRSNHACTHPDNPQSKAAFVLSEPERRRIYARIDLNVPYYGSSETAHPDAIGCRQIYPADLDSVLVDVGQRRCASCHPKVAPDYQAAEQQQGNVGWHQAMSVPRHRWTRIMHPELNDFLLAPLARSAGGTEACGQVVYESTDDPDYQKILRTFDAVNELLKKRPRLDMPGGRPAENMNRCSE